MTIKMKNIKACFTSKVDFIFQAIIMSLVIFNPPILTFNCIHIIALFSWIIIALNYKNLYLIFNMKYIFKVYIIILVLGVYQLLVSYISSGGYTGVVNYVFWLFEIIPYCVCVTLYYRKKKYTDQRFFNTVIFAGAIQSILAVLALTIPEIKVFFIGKIISYGYSDVHIKLSLFRNFGLADALTFTSSIVQAMIASLSLFFYIYKKRIIYFFAFFLCTVGAVINTRTSIVILLTGMVLLLLFLRKAEMIYRFIKTFIIISSFIFGSLGMLESFNDWTYDWLMEGASEIVAFLLADDENQGYFNYLSLEHMPLPDNVSIITGSGVEIMHGLYGLQSDIGYINDIWRIGLLASVVIYILYFMMIKKFINYKSSLGKFMFCYLLISAAFINVKGYFFVYNNVTTMIWILFFYACCQKEKDDKYNKGNYELI
jgi:hypothetical protein